LLIRRLTIISTNMNVTVRCATEYTLNLALTAKHTAVPPIAVRYNVKNIRKNFATSNWNPSQHHTGYGLILLYFVDIFIKSKLDNVDKVALYQQTVLLLAITDDQKNKK